jgi:hypothetical protein
MYIRQRRMRDAGELVAYGCLTWCVKMDGVQTDMLVTGFFFMFFGRSWNRSVFFFPGRSGRRFHLTGFNGWWRP